MRRRRKKSRFEKYLSAQFRSNAATECRIIGAFIGLLAIITSWGWVTFDDGVTTYHASMGPLTLILGDAVLMVGAISFIIATIASFIDSRFVGGQIIGAAIIAIFLPEQLAKIQPPDWLEGPVTTTISTYGWGTILAIISIALVMASFIIGGRIGHYRDKEEKDVNVHRSGMNDPFSFGGGKLRP